MKMQFSSTTCAVTVALGLAAGLAATSGCSKSEEVVDPPSIGATPASESLFTQPLQPSAPAGAVLAIVNGKEITQAEFDVEVQNVMQRMQGRVPPERMAQMQMQMREQLLENLVTRELLFGKVRSEGIEITDEEFQDAVAEITEGLPPGMSLEDMLMQTGTSMQEFRENFSMDLKLRKLIESHTGGKIEATDEEIVAFYEENEAQFQRQESVSARHILLGFDPADDSDEAKAAKRAELEAIRDRVAAGEDFATLAAEHSTCPSGQQGGSLGSFTRGRMVPEFEQAAFTQEVGEVGEIVETQFGYHLIVVDEQIAPGVTPLDEMREQIARHLTGQKQQEVVQQYIETLKASANITFPNQP